MRRLRVVSSPALVVLFLALLISSPVRATVDLTYLQGTAEVRSEENPEWESVSEGETVPRGAQLRTGDSTYLQLTTGAAGQLRLNEKTGLTLTGKEKPAELLYGSLSVSVDTGRLQESGEEFEVKTPNAVLGVRGTEFKVAYELDQKSWVDVDSGAVELSAGSSERLGPGEGADVSSGTETDRSRVRRRESPREELELTWGHWRKRKQLEDVRERLKVVEEKIERLVKKAGGLDTGPGLEEVRGKLYELRNTRDELKDKLVSRKQRYREFSQKYQNYRKNLEQRREDFIKRRQQAFESFIEERRKRFEEFKRKQREGY